MTLSHIIILIFLLAVFAWATVTHVYPYMQKNTNNPVLYTFLSFVALVIITSLTRGDMLLRALLVNQMFGPMFR
jgi:hypothetical protein